MTMTDVATITTMLSAPEAEALQSYERIIERGLTTFYDVGNALLVIRDQRLYRSTHDTFEAYTLDRWGMSDRHGRRLIDAAEVVDKIREVTGPMGPVPTSERQARELVNVAPAVAAEVMAEVVRLTPRPTAHAVRTAVTDRSQTMGARMTSPRRQPLSDDLRRAMGDVGRMERKLRKVADDDRLKANAELIRLRYGSDLARLHDVLGDLLERIGATR